MEKKCIQCEKILSKDFFSKYGWKRIAENLIRCKDCCKSQGDGPPRKKPKTSANDGDGDKGSQNKDSNNIQPKKKRPKKEKRKKETTKKKELDPELVKSKLKERINAIPRSDRNKIQLEWDTMSISESDEKAVADKIVVKGCYGPLDEQQMAQIRNHIESTQMTLSQAISLRSAYLQQKVMYRHEILQKQAQKFCNQYKQGCTILDLAKKNDQPPMNVFRTILAAMKWSKAEIKNALRDPKKFEERERNEFIAAESADVVSMVKQAEIHENSEIFEDVLAAWLEQKGIRFVRQKQLETEQKEEFGTAMLTPDFLLLDQVDIEGVPCHWIDCKAFYGANLQFTIKKTKKQMARYINYWGSGAIVYLQGFSEAVKMEDCALLNAYGALDIKILSQLEENNCAAINRVSTTVFHDDKGK